MDGAKGGAIAAVFLIVSELLVGSRAATFALMSVWLGVGAWIVYRRTPLRTLALAWFVLAAALLGGFAASATGNDLEDLAGASSWPLALAVGLGTVFLVITMVWAANRADSRRHPQAWAVWIAALKGASIWDMLTFRYVPYLR